MERRKTLPALLIVLLLGMGSVSANMLDPYERVIIAHRGVQVSYEGIVKKSSKWPEPLRSALLQEFSRENLLDIAVGVLRQYANEAQARELAEFWESPLGQKFVAAAHDEYDLSMLTDAEQQEMSAFEETEAYLSFSRFSEQGMARYHDILRQRTQKVVDAVGR